MDTIAAALLWLSQKASFVSLWIADNREFVGQIVTVVGGGLIVFGLLLMYQRRRRIKSKLYSRYRYLRKRVIRIFRYVTPRGDPDMLSKWQKGPVADHIGDALLTLNANDIISNRQYRRLMKMIGIAVGLSDLLPGRSYSDKAIKKRIELLKYNKLAGPKHPIPGAPPPLPEPEPVQSSFLSKMRNKTAKAA